MIGQTPGPLKSWKMKISRIFLFLSANFVTASVAYYRKCYENFSLCLITNKDYEIQRSGHLGYSSRNQSSASNWCRDNSSMLAIITNETIKSAVEQFSRDPSAELYSLDIITNGYRYKEQHWTWTDGRQSDITWNADYDYAYLRISPVKTVIFFHGHAPDRRKFVCSLYRHNSVCPQGYIDFQRRCYRVHNEKVTWFGARSICLRTEGSDIANFENTDISSFTSERGQYEEHWIGLRTERWNWSDGRNDVHVRHSNYWSDGYPYSARGNCLCLESNTRKWKNCDCSKPYRFICIQGYVPDSASTVTTSTRKIATTTTKTTTTTTKITTTAKTTTQTLDDNYGKTMSENLLNASNTSGLLPAVSIGIACLLTLIIVIAVVAFLKTRRSSPSGNPQPSQKSFSPPTTNTDDTPSTVYAVVVPNANEPVRTPSEKAPNQTVYAELDLAPKRKTSLRASEPVRSHSEENPNQTVYEELYLVPRGKTQRRDVGIPESEYANSLHVDSVYANTSQTRV